MTDLKARAKINLSLDVKGIRPDGYHEICTIMQTLELYDRVWVWIIDSGVQIQCADDKVPCDEQNTAYKAAALMQRKYKIKSGIAVKLEKNIPISAGLAGGSADAAAVVKAINKKFNLKLSNEQLIETGKEIGADVPFCIVGGTALAEGIGEILTPLKPLPSVKVLLVCPRFGVSTAKIFEQYREKRVKERPDTCALLKAIDRGDINALASGMVNVLESVTAREHTIINKTKAALIKYGALGSQMSGSGPTVFGLFDDEEIAVSAAKKLRKRGLRCLLTNTFNEES
ncbi:MAG: 4-(cytidine 5'-diphospho)-2-C-methyl-D-erythritol kinase [Eubacteriales bacterium]|nr:4-(cytidine 5'-diphospho)-2-C-methyl-D-erythritol kinase [Eubacteriales bacterium]